jgi:hypothetical protein
MAMAKIIFFASKRKNMAASKTAYKLFKPIEKAGNYFLLISFDARKTINTITPTTASIPTQTPALKIPSTTWQLLRVSIARINERTANLIFISGYFKSTLILFK